MTSLSLPSDTTDTSDTTGRNSVPQSRAMSFVEAATNIVVGYVLALAIQIVAFPLFGLNVSLLDNLVLGLLFTSVSLLRGYILRRLFERFRLKRR